MFLEKLIFHNIHKNIVLYKNIPQIANLFIFVQKGTNKFI